MRLLTAALLGGLLIAQPARAGKILYVTAARQQRIDGFCIRGQGNLDADPSRQEATAGDDPRRLFVTTSASGAPVLYVAEADRVEAFAIQDNGQLIKIGAVERKKMNSVSIEISPNKQILYIDEVNDGRIIAQPLDAHGAPTGDFTSCVQLPINSGRHNLLVRGVLLYVASFAQVSIFGIDVGGNLFGVDADGIPVAGSPSLCVPPEPNQDRYNTTPISIRKGFNGTRNLVIAPNTAATDTVPAGADILYVDSFGYKRIVAFALKDGLFDPPNPTTTVNKKNKQVTKQQPFFSRTAEIRQYQEVLLAQIEGNLSLIGTNFFRGRVDSFSVKADGTLPKQPTQTSEENLRATNVFGAVDNENKVVYAAAPGLDRVQAFRLNDRGLVGQLPFSETSPIAASFSNAVAIALVPGACN